MEKANKTSKKGCWWRSLMIFLILLLAAGTALLVNFVNNKNSVDAKFQQLINLEFDTAQFSDNVSRWRDDFTSKIRSATGLETVCDDAGNVKFDILISEDSRLINDWNLTRYDLAIYCSERNRWAALGDDGTAALRGMTSCNRIEWNLSAQTCQYKIIYQIIGADLASSIPLSVVPDCVYLTVVATVDLSSAEPVKMYNYTFNNLTGEDNEYCLKVLFESLAMGESAKSDFAYTPFAYLDELTVLWECRLAVRADNDVIALKAS